MINFFKNFFIVLYLIIPLFLVLGPALPDVTITFGGIFFLIWLFYNKKKLSYDYLRSDDELFTSASKYIADGKVIGWFQGKMEFGPRALGNRSILADPRNPNMKDIINKKIKRRESFRPFAPSVLEEFQSEWFEGNFFSPYMSSLMTVKKDKR